MRTFNSLRSFILLAVAAASAQVVLAQTAPSPGDVQEVYISDRGTDEAPGNAKAMPSRGVFVAYPNPFSGHLKVRFDTSKVHDMVLISLRNAKSGAVEMKIEADPREEAVLDTGFLAEGIYILEVQDLSQGFGIGAIQVKK